MARRLVAVSFALVPCAVALRLLGAPPVAQFAAGAFALFPIAWLISKATEDAGHHTGPAVGGLLNATFGNAVELLVSFFAISEGLFEVVRGSLAGSVPSNLLLVLGLAVVAGRQLEPDRVSIFASLALVVGAAALLAVAAVPHWRGTNDATALAAWAFPTCGVLLGAYVAVYAVLARHDRGRDREEDDAEARWSLARSLAALGVGVVLAGLVSELVTGSIEGFARATGLSLFFVSAVLVALAGNAAEHGAAVFVAARGQAELGAEVAVRSAAQVAALVIPAVALLSWLIDPLPLAFRPVELIAVGGAAVAAAAALACGRPGRVRGAALALAYLVVVAAFYLAG